MLYEYARLHGSHKSPNRYRHAKDAPAACTIYQGFIDQIDGHYEGSDEADRKTVWYRPAEEARKYRAYEREMREKMYSEIAERCGGYDEKQKSKDLER